MSEHREATVQLESRIGRPAAAVLERLRMARARRGSLTAADVDRVAAELDLPRAHVNGAAAFSAPRGSEGRDGPEGLRSCAGTACLASGASEDRASTRVYCLGYCYAAPAALWDEQPLTGPRAEPRDPPIPYEACVPEPVVLSRLAGAGPDGWAVWPRVLAGGGANARAGSGQALASARPRRRRLPCGREVEHSPRVRRRLPLLRNRERRRGRPGLVRGPPPDGERPGRGAGGHGAGRAGGRGHPGLRGGPAADRAGSLRRRPPAGPPRLERRGLQRPRARAAGGGSRRRGVPRRAGRRLGRAAPRGGRPLSRARPGTVRRRSRRPAPRRPCLRRGRQRRDRVRAGDHRARPRHRRRAHSRQPGRAHRKRGQRARRRREPAARSEQRAGRLRHGALPDQLPGYQRLSDEAAATRFEEHWGVPPGDARTDFDILQSVAAALGADLGCRTPAEAMDEVASLCPPYAGISHSRLDRDGPLHWPCRGPEDPGEGRLYTSGFHTPSGRAELAALPYLPPGERPDAEHPYVLVTGRRLEHYNAGTMTRRTSNLDLLPEERLEIHTADAERLGVGEGDEVTVSSRRGAVTLPAHPTERVAPGELFMAFHFPEALANLLTSQATDTVTGCPEYKVTAVALERAH